MYLDQRGGGRSDTGRPERAQARPVGRRRPGALRRARDRAAGRARARLRLARCDRVRRPLPGPPGALVLVGAGRADGAGAVDRDLRAARRRAAARGRAERFYGSMDEHAFADFLRVCFPLLSSYELSSDVIVRADWSPEVLIGWMRGEAAELDLRDELAAIRVPRSCSPARTTRGRRSPPCRRSSGASRRARRSSGASRGTPLGLPATPTRPRGARALPRRSRWRGRSRMKVERRERHRALLRRRRCEARARGAPGRTTDRPSCSSTRGPGSTIPSTRSISAPSSPRRRRCCSSTCGATAAATRAAGSCASTSGPTTSRGSAGRSSSSARWCSVTASGRSSGSATRRGIPTGCAAWCSSAPFARLVPARLVEAFRPPRRPGGRRGGTPLLRALRDHLTLAEYLRRCVPLFMRYVAGAESLARLVIN